MRQGSFYPPSLTQNTLLTTSQLATADKIVAQLGGGADAIAAAIGMVTAEKNTNPFANGNVQNVCGDPSLPATQELRGITPLIDPAVDTSGGVAALSAQTAGAPLDATGKSVFDLLSEAGFGDLVQSQNGAGGAAAGGAATGGAATGGAATGGAATGGNAQADNNNNNNNQAGNNNNNNQAGNNNNNNQAGNNNQADNTGNNAGNADNNACNADNADNAGADANTGDANNNQNQNQNGNANNGNNNAADQQNQNGNNNANNGNANNGNNNANNGNANGGAAAGGAADFGQCTPTIFRQGGLGGRPATEFTFQITDELARGGQQEALNPNIITNALCNQLTNVCGANAAAVAQCESAKAAVQAAGTRDDSTVTLFNNAIQGGATKKRGVAVAFRA